MGYGVWGGWELKWYKRSMVLMAVWCYESITRNERHHERVPDMCCCTMYHEMPEQMCWTRTSDYHRKGEVKELT